MRTVSRLPAAFSERAGGSSVTFSAQGAPWDYAIAGYPFLSATSDDRPMVRSTAPVAKEQQDTEPEPGEQSLTGWWLRSQESFHKGAGVLYQESRIETAPSERFRESMGIDVWTPGQVTLLPSVQTLQSATNTSLLAQGMDGDTPVVFQASGAALYRITETTSTLVSWGGTNNIIGLEVWDGYYYAIDSTGVYRGTVAGGAGSVLWTLSSATSAFYKRAGGFALLLVGNKAYDVTDETAAPTLPAALITLKETGWKWTGACAGPGDVRAAGHANGQSAVWRFDPTISSSGWTFAQTSGLPRGEVIYSLANYYNSFLVLATSKGVRFAAYGTDEALTFGPLTWDLGVARGVHVLDRWVYASVEAALADGNTGLVRIDPETEITDGRFAWANDLNSGSTSQPGSVCDLDGRVVFAVNTGSVIEHETQLVSSGYLLTGRIRFRTLEPKLFKYLRIRTDPLEGSIAVEAITSTDSSADVATYSTQGDVVLEESALPLVLGPQESMALRFTLTRSDTDSTAGPLMRSYQIKVLPAPHRQRIFSFWVSCFDRERARNGKTMGARGYGLERLEALEAAEETSDVVTFQDLATGRTKLVFIDRLQFVQTSPREKDAWGGYLQVTLRTV